MKTSTQKALFATLVIMLVATQVIGQIVASRIDVRGSRYSDTMWMFAVPSCSTGFDNGWDAFKMFGTTSIIPSLFAWEGNSYFQIDAVPTYNNTYLGFKAGEDSIYTLTFTHQLIETYYNKMVLFDSVANKTVDVFANGATYTFSVKPTDTPIMRFKIIASMELAVVTPDPVVVPDPVVTPVPVVTPDPVVVPVPVVTPTPDPVVVPVPVVTPPVVTPPVVTPDPVVVADNKGKKDNKDGKDKDKKDKKKMKIYSSGKNIIVENPEKRKGKLKIMHAVTGRMLKVHDFNANGTTIISAGVNSGSYVVCGDNSSEVLSTNVILR